MQLLIVIYIFYLCTELSSRTVGVRELENGELQQCELTMRKMISEDKMMITDETASRLSSTWLSQECEIRTGPQHIVRKYSFFENGTFLLLRHHYAEESCSIATYTVVARGSIEISLPSATVPGATEANVQLDSVRLIPFNRQVARTFGRRMKVACNSSNEMKWRPYVAQLIYERPINLSSIHILGLDSNSYQNRLSRSRHRHTLNCLESFGIEFNELRLFRVERKPRSNWLIKYLHLNHPDSIHSDPRLRAKIELLFGQRARNSYSKKILKPNRLQAAALLRADTIADCPICGSVFRGTEYNPPLFHQNPPLPAVIVGSWISNRCESVVGGFWSRRFLRIYSNSNKWLARWTYYTDATCSTLVYTVNASGRYVLRAVEQGKREEMRLLATNSIRKDVDHDYDSGDNYEKRNGDEKLTTRQFSPIKQQRKDQSDQRKIGWLRELYASNRIRSFSTQHFAKILPSGTIELILQIRRSYLIPVDETLSSSCDATRKKIKELRAGSIVISISLKNCRLRVVETPAFWTLRARISLDWNGDYTLLLASREEDIWEAPLRRCSAQNLQNSVQADSGLRESLREQLFSSQEADVQRRLFDKYARRCWSSFYFSSVSPVSFNSFSTNWISLILLCYLQFFI